MKKAFPLLGILAVLAAMAAFELRAQQLPRANIKSIFPAGAQQGTSVDVLITGGDLDGANRLFFSHKGITATPKKNQDGKVLANQYTVTIADNVPVGIHDVQTGGGRFGVSNVRAFAVGDLPEEIATAGSSAKDAMQIALGTTVNGQASARNYSYFKVNLKKGQRVLVECQARILDSNIAPVLILKDANGLELERNRFGKPLDFTPREDGEFFVALHDFTYRGGATYAYRLTVSQRPHIDFILPPVGKPGSNGKYTVYGRNLPGGSDAGFSLEGKLLQKKEVSIALPGNSGARVSIASSTPVGAMTAGFDGIDYRLPGPSGLSNPARIYFSGEAIVNEVAADNDQPSTAQKISVPCDFIGQFYPRRDRDWVMFEAKKDEVFWVEVFSERLGATTNPFLRIQSITKDAKGVEKISTVKEIQDSPVNIGGARFNTTTVDPAFRFVAPADGAYRILIYDLYDRGSADSIYRLSIRREAPDFRLVAMTEGPIAIPNQALPMPTGFMRRGQVLPLRVMAFRRDNFAGPIELSIAGLPPQITASKAALGPGQNSAFIMLTAKADAPDWSGDITITGKASIADKPVTRTARNAAVTRIAYDTPTRRNLIGSRLNHALHLQVSGEESVPVSIALKENKTYEHSKFGNLKIPLVITQSDGFKGVDKKIKCLGHGVFSKFKDFTIPKNKNDGTFNLNLNTYKLPVGEHVLYLRTQVKGKYSRVSKARLDAAKADQKKADAAAAEADKAAKAAASELAAINAKKDATPDQKTAAQKKNDEAISKKKIADAAKATSATNVKNLTNVAKPKDITATFYSQPIKVKITAAPIVLQPVAAHEMKQGAKMEFAVSIERKYGFADPVTVGVALPKGTSGLAIGKLTIGKGQNTGKITITANDKATLGDLALNVEATMKLQNQTIKLTQPLALKISAAPKAASK